MGLYLYCLTDRKPEIEASGIHDSEVYSLKYKKLYPIVSQMPFKEEMEPDEEEVSKHKDISQLILEDQAVVPVAYGMLFKSKKVLLNTVSEVYPTLRRSYLAVRDKVELGVKALKSGDEKEVDPKEILQPFDGIAFKHEQGQLFSDRLLLNSSFLVKRESVPEFSDKVDELREEFENLKFKYSGPWPPYNFVDVKVMKRGG